MGCNCFRRLWSWSSCSYLCSASWLENFGCEEGLKIVLDPIVRVEKKDKLFEVETDTEGTYFGKTVILGTGMNPKKLKVKGSDVFDSKGVHYCATCDGILYKG